MKTLHSIVILQQAKKLLPDDILSRKIVKVAVMALAYCQGKHSRTQSFYDNMTKY